MQTPGSEILLHISVATQTLEVRCSGHEVQRRYAVSTSRFGLGSEPGGLRTPLGRFKIHAKIGADAPVGTVFKSRVALDENGLGSTADDLILSRILWLAGLEAHNANTLERYIYIHGTNHEGQIGQPASHGCVRMANADVIELYDLVEVGTELRIVEH